jgi:uncharacterized protein with NAD-binding domain and iron-sulfur cluster
VSLPRIVILGGGVGSVTTAIKLSKPGWEQHYKSITMLQQGWRLGGKGASGRGRDLRIEEHGLHIWFGFYENAFQMLAGCHSELDARAAGGAAVGGGAPQPRWPLAFATIGDSFRPVQEIMQTDHDGCSWKLWPADFFAFDNDRPWRPTDPNKPSSNPNVLFYAARCLELAGTLAWSLEESSPGLKFLAGDTVAAEQDLASVEASLEVLWASLGGGLQEVLSAAAQALDSLAVFGLEDPFALTAIDVVVRALQLAFDYVHGRHAERIRSSDLLRRAGYVIDLMIAATRGVIEDGVIEDGSFDGLDGVDFRSWLMAHGASRETVDSALVRTLVYDLPFAYLDGDPQRPACSTTTALRGLMRLMFTYRGAVMWKMNSGMGDVVFAPMYELLVKRGVEVKFFHRVEAVRAKGGVIEEIEVDVQASVAPGTGPRDFLMGPQALWPASPDGVLSPPVQSADVYESWYVGRKQAFVSTTTLRRGDPTDGFELVVFGLPISCVEHIAPDLPAQSVRWQGAVTNVRTVATQALQLWLTVPAARLGEAPEGTVLGGFVEPFDTWADMHQLVAQERVPGSATVAYFCNAYAASPAPPRGQADQWLADQNALVRAQAVRFLRRDIASLWPKVCDPISREFDWSVLVDPSGAAGEQRLDAQYWRANVEPPERYVLSVPGSTGYRIPPDDTDFQNLFAVGDWTACVIDAGCVEAAVISGMIAANAIHRIYGNPDHIETIIGHDSP